MIVITILSSLMAQTGNYNPHHVYLSRGDWKFIGSGPQSGTIVKPDINNPGWLSVSVPGDVNASLLEHGIIPDPHYDIQAQQSYWITSKEWWYVLQFDAPADFSRSSVLVFEGIDGTADIWLNNRKLGVAKNAFYPHKYNVKGILKSQNNILHIRFQSINELLGGDRPDGHRGWISRRGLLREPMYNFGIDWSLPVPSIGLSGNVYIENDIVYKLVNHSIRTYKSGRVDFTFEVSEEARRTGYSIKLNVNGHGANLQETIKRGTGRSYVSLQVPDPQLWWPNSGNAHVSSWKYPLLSGDDPENWRKHFEAVCSFNSEFCIQGPCNVKAIKTFMAPENHWPPNEAWIYHIQRGHRNIHHYEQTMTIAGAIFGEITSLQEYVKHGQATHLEQMRAEYESARRDRPDSGGTLHWMYHDCWPTSNWSIIDYYKQEKPSYYAAKRACTPVLPIIFERGGSIGFFLGDDTLSAQQVIIEYGQETLDGKKTWSKSASFKVSPNSTFNFDKIEKKALILSTGDYLFINAEVNGEALPRVVYFPDGWKDIPWPKDPGIKLEITDQVKHGEQWISSLKIRSDKFTRLCHILLKEKYESQILPASKELRIDISNNYFDLTAGGEHTVTISSARKLTTDDLHVGHWWTDWE